MADLVQTPANVKWVSGARPVMVKGGASIVRGNVLYKDTADLEHKLADADTDAASIVDGIALTDGTDGSDMLLAPDGATINVGATTTAGTPYVLSTTAGAIAVDGDLGTGDYCVFLFWGTGTANVTLAINKGAAVHA